MTIAWRSIAMAALLATGCAPRSVVIEAHRGFGVTSEESQKQSPGAPPENTIPAFRAGLAAGGDVLEMDAHLLDDDALAILHDDTLDRTTDAKGCISQLKTADLGAIDAGAHSSFKGRGVRVPTLDDVLTTFSTRLNVELKREAPRGCPRPSADDLATAMVRALDRASARPRVLVSSFDREVLARFHVLAPDVPTALLSTSQVTADEAQKLGVSAVQLNLEIIDRDQIELLHRAKIEVHAWTVDDPAVALHLVDLGIDRLITDTPQTLRVILARRTRIPPGIGRALVGCAVLLVVAWLSRLRSRQTG